MDEGTVYFDIRFVATVPSTGESIRLIINLEAQRAFHIGYSLLKRAMYYGCRLVSSQYNTEFVESNYDDIKKVYSIWICTDTPKSRQNTITKYKITEENIIGNVTEEVENYDLINVIMLCLAEDDEYVANGEGVLGLLRTLLSDRMSADTRKTILDNSYGIKPDRVLEKEMSGMCNLSYGVLERGIKQGLEQGREEGREEGEELATLKALKNLIANIGFTFDKAADALGISKEEREIYRSKI